MTWAQRWLGWLWERPALQPAVEPTQQATTPFLIFECTCHAQVELDVTVQPGEAATVQCVNCQEMWAVICPPLEVKLVKDVEALWPILSQ